MNLVHLREKISQTAWLKLTSGVIAYVAWGASPSFAQAMTAGVVMEKMGVEERAAYLAGVIEGLAYARYVADGKQMDGMACTYNWYYQADGTLRKIYDAFDRFADYTPGAVLAAMVEQECGG